MNEIAELWAEFAKGYYRRISNQNNFLVPHFIISSMTMLHIALAIYAKRYRNIRSMKEYAGFLYEITEERDKMLQKLDKIFAEFPYSDATAFYETFMHDETNYAMKESKEDFIIRCASAFLALDQRYEISQPPIAEFKNINSLYNIMQEDEMNFENFDEEKTVLFIIPDNLLRLPAP